MIQYMGVNPGNGMGKGKGAGQTQSVVWGEIIVTGMWVVGEDKQKNHCKQMYEIYIVRVGTQNCISPIGPLPISTGWSGRKKYRPQTL